MEELVKAIELRRRYNKMELKDCAKEFELYSEQKIPKSAIEDFRFLGLSNIDFLTSDFLNKYGLYNLLQIPLPEPPKQ